MLDRILIKIILRSEIVISEPVDSYLKALLF